MDSINLMNKTNEALKEFFSPEFLNRIDDIITFNKLSKSNILEISKLLLGELQEETKGKHILFDYTDNVSKYIADTGYNDRFGARPLRRTIQRNVEDLIAVEFLRGNIKENEKFTLDVKDDKVIIVEKE